MVPRVPWTEHTTQLLDGEHFSSPLPSTPFSSHFPIARFLLVRGGPWGWSLCSFIPLCWGRFTYQAVSLGPLAGHHFVSTPGKQQIGRRTTGDQRREQRLRVPTGCWPPRVQSLRGPCRDCWREWGHSRGSSCSGSSPGSWKFPAPAREGLQTACGQLKGTLPHLLQTLIGETSQPRANRKPVPKLRFKSKGTTALKLERTYEYPDTLVKQDRGIKGPVCLGAVGSSIGQLAGRANEKEERGQTNWTKFSISLDYSKVHAFLWGSSVIPVSAQSAFWSSIQFHFSHGFAPV